MATTGYYREHAPKTAFAETAARNVIETALEEVGFPVPDGISVVPAGDTLPGAPLMTMVERRGFAAAVRAQVPDCFKAPAMSDAAQAIISRQVDVGGDYGEVGMTAAESGAEAAIKMPHPGSVYARVHDNTSGRARGSIGEVAGRFAIGHVWHGNIMTPGVYRHQMLRTDRATKGDEGQIWVPGVIDSGQASIPIAAGHNVKQETVADIPPERITEALIINGFFNRIVSGDPETSYMPVPVNELLVNGGLAKTAVAVTTVAWSFGHRAVSVNSRRIAS